MGTCACARVCARARVIDPIAFFLTGRQQLLHVAATRPS